MDYVSAGLGVSFWAIAIIVLSVIGFCRTGSVLLGIILPDRRVLRGAEWALFSTGVGIIAFCLAMLGLGLAGVLTKMAAWLLLAVFIFLPLFFKKNNSCTILEPFPCGGCPQMIYPVLAVGMAGALFLSTIQALAPSTGMDALAYHLYLPKEFIQLGRMEFLPLTRESLWPLLNEMYFMFALLVQGTAAAQLFHWLFYGLTAIAIHCYCRRFLGRGTAWWASLIFVFTPVHFAQAGYPYVDLCLAFYVFLAAYLFVLATEAENTQLLFLSGIFAGAATATKYLGLDCALILFLMILFRFRGSWVKAAYFLLGCSLVGAVWYLRSWILAGNPFFPLYPKFFGGHGYEIDIAAGVGMGKGLIDFLSFPWNLTMYPAKFGGQMFGLLYILFIPPLIFAIKSMKASSRYLFAFALAYCFLLFQQSQQARFYVSVAPFAAIAAGYSLEHYFLNRGKFLRLLTSCVLGATLLFYAAIFVYRVRDQWKLVAGVVSAEDYLLGHERSFRGWQYLKKNALPTDKILNAAEVRYFYAPPGLNIKHWPQESVDRNQKGISISGYLAKENFDIIWVEKTADPAILKYINENPYNPIYHYVAKEKPDVFEYTIYRKV